MPLVALTAAAREWIKTIGDGVSFKMPKTGRIAYFDCFAGASGDMVLGALVDAGLDLDLLKGELKKLRMGGYDIHATPVLKKGISGTQVKVVLEEDAHHTHRGLSDIVRIIEESDLFLPVKQRSRQIFTRLAEAEAGVHRTSVEAIHFHELGAVDAVVDIVGAVVGLDALGVDLVACSPLHVGSGTVECAHGTLPVPAPATAVLLKGRPIYSTGIQGELVTPTGAAILSTLASFFGPMPLMTPERVGYGAGSADPPIPNLLRVLIGDLQDDHAGFEYEQTAVIQTTIDDMNPQVYGYVMDKALGMGALDIFLSPVQMKKNRPGTLVTVICKPYEVERFSRMLIRETTTIGLRWRVEHRIKAGRTIREVETSHGSVKVKMAQVGDSVVNISPEYDDCRRLALEHGVPLKEVMEAARAAAGRQLKEKRKSGLSEDLTDASLVPDTE